jgi:hypothetical protein
MCFIGMTGLAMAQGATTTAVPHRIGSRANGFSYQPIPAEVIPREVSAGVRPSKARQDATDQALEAIDRALLRGEGLSETSLPVFAPRR